MFLSNLYRVLKRFISIFFTIVFVAFVTAPAIITIIDNDVDISMFYTSSEEEEKGNEKNMDYEKLFFENPQIETTFTTKKTKYDLEYVYKNYPKPHINLIFSPPDNT